MELVRSEQRRLVSLLTAQSLNSCATIEERQELDKKRQYSAKELPSLSLKYMKLILSETYETYPFWKLSLSGQWLCLILQF